MGREVSAFTAATVRWEDEAARYRRALLRELERHDTRGGANGAPGQPDGRGAERQRGNVVAGCADIADTPGPAPVGTSEDAAQPAAVNHQRVQPLRGAIHRCAKSRGACADDQQVDLLARG